MYCCEYTKQLVTAPVAIKVPTQDAIKSRQLPCDSVRHASGLRPFRLLRIPRSHGFGKAAEAFAFSSTPSS